MESAYVVGTASVGKATFRCEGLRHCQDEEDLGESELDEAEFRQGGRVEGLLSDGVDECGTRRNSRRVDLGDPLSCSGYSRGHSGGSGVRGTLGVVVSRHSRSRGARRRRRGRGKHGGKKEEFGGFGWLYSRVRLGTSFTDAY